MNHAGAIARCFGSAGCVAPGKATLAQSLNDVEYFNCELPRVRRELDDPFSIVALILLAFHGVSEMDVHVR